MIKDLWGLTGLTQFKGYPRPAGQNGLPAQTCEHSALFFGREKKKSPVKILLKFWILGVKRKKYP